MNTDDDVIAAFEIRNKIGAIKAFRSAFALSLKSAKDLVESLIEKQSLRTNYEQLGRLMAVVGEQGPAAKWTWVNATTGLEHRDEEGDVELSMVLEITSAKRMRRCIDLRPLIEQAEADKVESVLGGPGPAPDRHSEEAITAPDRAPIDGKDLTKI